MTGTAALAGCLGLGGEPDTTGGPDLPTPTLGARDAAVVVAAWEDYRCSHCATFSAEVLPRIRESLVGADVRFEFHDFPLPVDRWSWSVAMAARSVQERVGTEAFWTFAETAFDRQPTMDSMTAIRSVAETAGADPATVAEDVRAERHRPVAARDRQAGRDRGVDSTPTVFVDGERVAGSYESIESAVESAL